MGIRLQCPQGHKVHVKSFLAGKRGVCPECGAKFDIPADPNVAAGDTTGDEIAVLPTLPDDLGSAAPTGDRARVMFDALADNAGLLGGFDPATKRIADRRKSAHTMRIFSLVLIIAATLLTCVLLYMVMRAR